MPLLALAALFLAGCGGDASPVELTSTPTTSQLEEASPIAGAPATPTQQVSPDVVEATPTEAAEEAPTPADSPSPPPAATEAQAPESVTSIPGPDGYSWNLVAEGLSSPVGMAVPDDGSERLFVLEQAGTIRIIQDGEVLGEPFLDIRDRVGALASEQGLLGLNFHPNYTENGFFYVNYTDRNGDTVIARFQVSADPNQADRGSEKRLLGVDQPFPNHNGGGVVFGPDGYLYLSLGDGGAAGDPAGNAQSLDTLLGKIVRIDVDAGDPYGIPPENPFVDREGLDEIWAYGLRNPWRFSFDQLSGDIYIGDVGQNSWEEVDFLPAGHPGGANFGWDYREGMHPFEGTPPADLALVDPVVEYSLSGGHCAATGGYVYRGHNLPAWQGVYLYGDYCSGFVWALLRQPDGSWQNTQLFDTDFRITSFGQDEAGEVYLVDHGGAVYQFGER